MARQLSLMLIFKNNIYEKKDPHNAMLYPGVDSYDRFEPHKLVKNSVDEDLELVAFIKRQPKEYWDEEIRKFFPQSYKFGGIRIVETILEILHDGLEETPHWYHMNTYHFSVLYDVLQRQINTYNNDTREAKIQSYPQLRGNPIDLAWFTKYYFFNMVFLLDEEKYNSMSGEDKKRLGFNCSCQFGAINGLTPVPEEMELKESKDYPYNIYV